MGDYLHSGPRARTAALAALAVLLYTVSLVRAAAPAGENGGPGRDGPVVSSGIQGWRQADDWDITYHLSSKLGGGFPDRTATLRVRYRRPDQVRVDVTDSEEPYTAIAGADSVRMYLPQSRLSVWAPLNEDSSFKAELLPGDFAIGPLPGEMTGKGPQLVPTDTIAAARAGKSGLRLLPEEVVAGRPALVVEDTSSPWSRRVSWVDKEYGLPLAGRTEAYGDERGAEFHAQEVHINQGVGPAVFSLDVSAGTVTFKGPFELEEARWIRSLVDEQTSSPPARIPILSILPDTPGPTRRVLALPRLPAGFRSVASQAIGGTGGWSTIDWYVNPTGAVIRFTEQGDTDGGSLLGVTAGLTRFADATPVKIGNRPATLYRHQKPYPGLILVWREQGIQAILEATDVPREELLTVAASVVPLEVTRQEEVILPDFATAASLLSMPIYRPAYLPVGAKLIRLTGAWVPGEGSLQVTASYALPRGISLTIRQREISAFPQPEAPPGEEPVNVPGGTASYNDIPLLTWLPKASHTKVVISGRVSKATMLKIARSLQPVTAAKQ